MAPSKQQHTKEARALLEGFWGELFNFAKPRAIKVGILQDMVNSAHERNLPFNEDMIKKALRVYTGMLSYQQVLARGGSRYDLQGNRTGEVTDEQKAMAKQVIRRYNARQRKKKLNRAVEAENQAKHKARKNAAENTQNGNKLSE